MSGRKRSDERSTAPATPSGVRPSGKRATGRLRCGIDTIVPALVSAVAVAIRDSLHAAAHVEVAAQRAGPVLDKADVLWLAEVMDRVRPIALAHGLL